MDSMIDKYNRRFIENPHIPSRQSRWHSRPEPDPRFGPAVEESDWSCPDMASDRSSSEEDVESAHECWHPKGPSDLFGPDEPDVEAKEIIDSERTHRAPPVPIVVKRPPGATFHCPSCNYSIDPDDDAIALGSGSGAPYLWYHSECGHMERQSDAGHEEIRIPEKERGARPRRGIFDSFPEGGGETPRQRRVFTDDPAGRKVAAPRNPKIEPAARKQEPEGPGPKAEVKDEKGDDEESPFDDEAEKASLVETGLRYGRRIKEGEHDFLLPPAQHPEDLSPFLGDTISRCSKEAGAFFDHALNVIKGIDGVFSETDGEKADTVLMHTILALGIESQREGCTFGKINGKGIEVSLFRIGWPGNPLRVLLEASGIDGPVHKRSSQVEPGTVTYLGLDEEVGRRVHHIISDRIKVHGDREADQCRRPLTTDEQRFLLTGYIEGESGPLVTNLYNRKMDVVPLNAALTQDKTLVDMWNGGIPNYFAPSQFSRERHEDRMATSASAECRWIRGLMPQLGVRLCVAMSLLRHQDDCYTRMVMHQAARVNPEIKWLAPFKALPGMIYKEHLRYYSGTAGDEDRRASLEKVAKRLQEKREADEQLEEKRKAEERRKTEEPLRPEVQLQIPFLPGVRSPWSPAGTALQASADVPRAYSQRDLSAEVRDPGSARVPGGRGKPKGQPVGHARTATDPRRHAPSDYPDPYRTRHGSPRRAAYDQVHARPEKRALSPTRDNKRRPQRSPERLVAARSRPEDFAHRHGQTPIGQRTSGHSAKGDHHHHQSPPHHGKGPVAGGHASVRGGGHKDKGRGATPKAGRRDSRARGKGPANEMAKGKPTLWAENAEAIATHEYSSMRREERVMEAEIRIGKRILELYGSVREMPVCALEAFGDYSLERKGTNSMVKARLLEEMCDRFHPVEAWELCMLAKHATHRAGKAGMSTREYFERLVERVSPAKPKGWK